MRVIIQGGRDEIAISVMDFNGGDGTLLGGGAPLSGSLFWACEVGAEMGLCWVHSVALAHTSLI